MAHSSLLLYLSVICSVVSVLSLQQDSHSGDSQLSELVAGAELALLSKQSEIPILSLQEDMEEFSSASSFHRSKRNAKEKHRIYPKCCGSGDTPDFTEDTVKIYEECKVQLNASDESTGAAACVIATCVARAKGALDANGYVITEQFVNLTEEAYTDEHLKDVAKQYGPYCVEKANKAAKQLMDDEQMENSCNLASIMAYHCTKYAVIRNCPEEEVVNSTECQKFLKMMEDWTILFK